MSRLEVTLLSRRRFARNWTAEASWRSSPRSVDRNRLSSAPQRASRTRIGSEIAIYCVDKKSQHHGKQLPFAFLKHCSSIAVYFLPKQFNQGLPTVCQILNSADPIRILTSSFLPLPVSADYCWRPVRHTLSRQAPRFIVRHFPLVVIRHISSLPRLARLRTLTVHRFLACGQAIRFYSRLMPGENAP